MTNVQKYWLNIFDNAAGAGGFCIVPGSIAAAVAFDTGHRLVGVIAVGLAASGAFILLIRGLLELYLGHRRAELKDQQLSLVPPATPAAPKEKDNG